MSTNKNYITAYLTYFQYFKQSLPFTPPPSLQWWCQMLFGGNFSRNTGSLVSNAIFENADNDLNNEVNADTSETESCISSESERNKESEAVGVISKPEFLNF